MLTKGDKLIVKKKVADFLDEGDIVRVIDVSEDTITFIFGEGFMHEGVMSFDEYERHFDKVYEKAINGTWAPSITSERIDEIIASSNIDIKTVFNKCTIVACQLPNGFVIVESSACVSPENYSEEIGVENCLNKIADKIWELEGYKLQNELYLENHNYDDCGSCCGNCDDCGCSEEDEELEEFEEEVNDCHTCDDYDCPYNLNNIKH